MPSTSSSSDSDEDESTMELLRSATDASFINDSMFKNVGKQNPSTENQDQPKTTPLINKQKEKSQRYLENDEDTKNANDLMIPESMQNFVYKKLSQKIADQIEFVDNLPSSVQPTEDESNICGVVKLLNDTEPIILTNDSIPMETVKPQKRPKIIKRKLSDDIIENNFEKRLNAAVITTEEIKKEVSNWKINKKDKKHFRYKEIESKCYLIEPETEFTKLRKQNNWNENKIAR